MTTKLCAVLLLLLAYPFDRVDVMTMSNVIICLLTS